VRPTEDVEKETEVAKNVNEKVHENQYRAARDAVPEPEEKRHAEGVARGLQLFASHCRSGNRVTMIDDVPRDPYGR
jgi:hypothetical protein